MCSLAASVVQSPLVRLTYSLTGYSVRGDIVSFLVATVATTAIIMRSIEHRPWSEIGLQRRAADWKFLIHGLTIGLGMIGVTIGILLPLQALRLVRTEDTGSWLATAVSTSLVLLLAALAEEILCRGYVLTAIREVFGTRAAVASTSVAFGLLHLQNPDVSVSSFSVVVLSGFALAGVRVLYDSLYAAWMAHFAWNWVMAVPLHAPVSGLHFASPGYKALPSGPAWLSGGSWGPEGGAAAIIGVSVGLAYLYTRRGREES